MAERTYYGDGSMEPKEKGIYFDVPKNYQAPAEAQGGEPFEQICKLHMSEDGKQLCLLAVGDAEIDNPEHKKDAAGTDDRDVPDYKAYGRTMVNELRQGGMTEDY